MTSSGKEKLSFKTLVSLHNIVNIPNAATSAKCKFVVALQLVRAVGNIPVVDVASTECPDVSCTLQPDRFFYKNDVLQATSEAAQEWTVVVPATNRLGNVDVVVTVAEVRSKTKRQLCKQKVALSLQTVLDRKLVTEVVGLSFGQVGISFAVAPSDRQGYRKRLVTFVERRNPASVSHIDDVVARVDEISSFTRVFKKYKVVDYRVRVRDFFEMYGPEFMDAVDANLAEWKDREEEFVRSLVLDNGPEPSQIDPRRRLMAFSEAHSLGLKFSDIDRLLTEHKGGYDAMFKALREKHGGEPDPRSYLFPPTTYAAPDFADSPASEPVPDASPKFERGPETPASSSTNVAADHRPRSAQNRATTPPPVDLTPTHENVLSRLRQNQTRDAKAQHANAAPQLDSNDLWNAFTNDLRSCHVPPSELFYLTQDAVSALVSEMGYPHGTRLQLLAEWQRRVNDALKVTYLSPGDSSFESVRAEVVSLSGLDALKVQVVGVVALRNSEHDASHAVRLAAAKQRNTERFLCAGEYGKLMESARHSFANASSGISFARKPLFDIDRPTSVAVLVCDVIVGKSLLTVGGVDSVDTRGDFAGKYDSVTTYVNSDAQRVVVFTPQQVLARYLVHCNVDPSVVGCPVHPSKTVEFFVPAHSALACSQCVVLGPHTNAKVVPIEEAAAQARSQLTEAARRTDAAIAEHRSAEAELARQADSISGDGARREVLERAEEIKRDAERRAAELIAAHEADVQARTGELGQQRDEIAKSREELSEKLKAVEAALRSGNAARTLSALQSIDGDAVTNTPRTYPPVVSAPRDQSTLRSATPAPAPQRNDLFSKFMHLKGAKFVRGAGEAPVDSHHTAVPDSRREPDNKRSNAPSDREKRLAKDQMTAGWNAFRAGNKAEAHRLWSEIFERNGENVVGARARAYICEALDRDVENAAVWYERALRAAPNDVMTLFNYGVMLEGAGKRREALSLFESAARLGDHTAGRRAEMLRTQL